MVVGFISLVLVALTGSSDGARLLLLPAEHHPHVNFFALAGKHLADAGHDVVLLTMERHKDLLEKIGVPHILHHGVKAKSVFQEPGKNEAAVFGGKLSFIMGGMSAARTLSGQCEEMLESKDLKETLENKKFDIALVDGFDMARCLYIFPYRLGIPYITLTARHDPWQARVPALPSAEGNQGLVNLTPNSSIIHRLLNTFVYIVSPALSWLASDNTLLTRFAPNRPQTTFSELFRNSEMFLVNLDTMCLDVPRVSAPHYQFVGGMGNRPAKPLPQELASFMADAKTGVIVVTFGSTIKSLTLELVDKLMDGFSQIEQRVIMRFNGTVSKSVPSNVKIADWLPQNDLLGHSKTKLFITHTGNNGRMEALYHGVPMLCMPVFGDQINNAIQVAERRFGLRLDWDTFTPEELVNNIDELINNPIYKENIQKCSKILQDFPSPQETIKFWVEHILKFGSSHLRPPYMEMPLWKFFMLDIILIISITLLCIVFVVYRCCRFVHRKCCRKQRKQKKE